MADKTTTDLLGLLHDIPVRKGMLMPLTQYGDNSARLDWSAGLPGALWEAFTAPARAYRGEIPDEQMIPEGLNFAGSVALGSAAVPRPAARSAQATYTKVFSNPETSAAPGLGLMAAAKQAGDMAKRYNPYRGMSEAWMVPLAGSWGYNVLTDHDPNTIRELGRAAVKTATFGLGVEPYNAVFGEPTAGEYAQEKYGMERPSQTAAARVRGSLRYGDPQNKAHRVDRDAVPLWLEQLHALRSGMMSSSPPKAIREAGIGILSDSMEGK